MNRHTVWGWIIVGLTLVGVVILIWRRWDVQRQAKLSSAGQERLARYIDLLNQDDGRIVTVQETVRAQAPEQFEAMMSQSTPGLAVPLSFPPNDLWCAMLVSKPTTDPVLNVPLSSDVVLVARHSGQSEWVIHTLPAGGDLDAPETQHILSTIGCVFEKRSQ